MTPQSIPFATHAGQKLTIFTITLIGHTIRQEVEIIGEYKGRPILKHKGQRKEYYLSVESGDIVLEGWNLPLRADSDGNIFFANDCFNIVANSSEELKQWLDKSLIPVTDNTKAKVLFIPMTEFNQMNGVNEIKSELLILTLKPIIQ